MRTLRVIIAGGRGFHRPDIMKMCLDVVFSKARAQHDDIIIVSGTAQGADRMGEQYAVNNHMEVDRYPADWDRYGKSAGYKRNEQMARAATHLVAFWDGESRGTKHMINIAIREGLEVRVFTYEGGLYATRTKGSVQYMD